MRLSATYIIALLAAVWHVVEAVGLRSLAPQEPGQPLRRLRTGNQPGDEQPTAVLETDQVDPSNDVEVKVDDEGDDDMVVIDSSDDDDANGDYENGSDFLSDSEDEDLES